MRILGIRHLAGDTQMIVYLYRNVSKVTFLLVQTLIRTQTDMFHSVSLTQMQSF
jgi:hypothetical protein